MGTLQNRGNWVTMKIHCNGYRIGLVFGVHMVANAVLPSSSYPAENDAVVIGPSTDLKETGANTKIFTGNEQNDNVLAAGLLGLGLGVGGVVLAQAVLDKPDCRYKRFDMGGLFGGNKDCHKKPSYPSRPSYQGGGGYREPHHDRPYRPPHHERPYRPSRPYRPARPYKEPYRSQRPYDDYDDYHRPAYQEPHRPYRPTQKPYREPYREPYRHDTYREPDNSYKNPKPTYSKPAVYRPTNQHSSSPYYPDRPIRGRTVDLDGEDSKTNFDNDDDNANNEPTKLTNESNDTGGLLSGRVRFAD